MNSTTKVLIAMAMAVVVSVSFVFVSAHADGAEGEFIEIGTADELKSCIGTDGQYRLTADIGLGDLDADNGSAFTVPSGVTVTLDLNGHDITASIASDNGNYTKAQIIRNEGNLTILDNSDGEHGSIDNQGQSYPCTLTIYNSAGATLTIQNVSVISEEAVAIDNRGTCHIKEGTVLLAENDTFAGGGWDNTCAAIENRGAGNLYIDGATVTSVSQAAVFSDSSGITEVRNSTVSGSPAYGDFNGTTADTNIRVYSGLFSCDPSTVVDSGSLVSVTEDGYEVNPISGTSAVTVSSPGELQSTIEGVGPSELLMVELATDDVLTGNITILVSHNMADVARLSDKILVIDSGHLVVCGTPKEVFSQTEELEKVGLDLPPITRLTEELRKRGMKIEPTILSIDEAAGQIAEYLKARGNG